MFTALMQVSPIKLNPVYQIGYIIQLQYNASLAFNAIHYYNACGPLKLGLKVILSSDDLELDQPIIKYR